MERDFIEFENEAKRLRKALMSRRRQSPEAKRARARRFFVAAREQQAEQQARQKDELSTRNNEYKRLDVASFLARCEPKLDAWSGPLQVFGCNTIEQLEIIALWDEIDIEHFFRRVMAQPAGSHLAEADLIFLIRNLAERFLDGL